jgi:hypothetical protein
LLGHNVQGQAGRLNRIQSAGAYSGQERGAFHQLVAGQWKQQAMLERFLTTLDCVHVAFISDQTLDQLPLPSQVGKTKVGGVEVDKPRIRNALTAVLALGPAPTGFKVAQLAAKVRAMTGQAASDYTVRQAPMT